MADSFIKDSPAKKMETAQASFAFALRLFAEVEAGRITTDIYKQEARVETGGGEITVPPFDDVTEKDLQVAINNLLLTSLYSSAIVTDEVLFDVFGKNDPNDPDQSRNGFRVIVRQLRNAFSHTPWYPRWLIRDINERKAFPIKLDDGTTFTFDATSLHGSGLKLCQIGGMEFWVKLLAHCERIVPR